MPIVASRLFDSQKIKTKDGDIVKIPDSIYPRLKNLCKINKFLSDHECKDKRFGLGMAYDYFFHPRQISISQSMKEIKDQLTFNQKKKIKDLRQKDSVIEYVKELNQRHTNLYDDLKDFCYHVPIIEDLAGSKTKDKNIQLLFRVAQKNARKIYELQTLNKFDGKPFNLFAAKSTSYDDFLDSEYWFNVKSAILARDGWHCQKCGAVSNLHIHHKTYQNHMDEKNNLKDLITLCQRCHTKEHKQKPMQRTIPARFKDKIPGMLIIEEYIDGFLQF